MVLGKNVTNKIDIFSSDILALSKFDNTMFIGDKVHEIFVTNFDIWFENLRESILKNPYTGDENDINIFRPYHGILQTCNDLFRGYLKKRVNYYLIEERQKYKEESDTIDIIYIEYFYRSKLTALRLVDFRDLIYGLNKESSQFVHSIIESLARNADQEERNCLNRRLALRVKRANTPFRKLKSLEEEIEEIERMSEKEIEEITKFQDIYIK